MRHHAASLGLLGAACLCLSGATNSLAFAEETLPEHARTGAVERRDRTVFVGVLASIHSINEATATTAVAGRIEWLADAGAFVRRGEPVARLDRRVAELHRAAKLAEVGLAEIKLRHAARELARTKSLIEQNNASRAQYERLQFEHDAAAAELSLAQVELEHANERLAHAEVNAPFDGQIVARHQRVGKDVEFGSPIVSMQDPRRLEARVAVPARYLASRALRVGEPLHDAEAGLEGTVSAVIRSVDAQTQAFEVRIKIAPHAPEAWAPGQTVRLKLPVDRYAAALTVDQDAVIIDETGAHVIRIRPGEGPRRISVQVGEGLDGAVILTPLSGELVAGDEVLIRGGERMMQNLLRGDPDE